MIVLLLLQVDSGIDVGQEGLESSCMSPVSIIGVINSAFDNVLLSSIEISCATKSNESTLKFNNPRTDEKHRIVAN